MRGLACATEQVLQKAAQQALGRRVGAVVVVRVANGRILALVNPEYAVRRAYPPGSAIKFMGAYAALADGAWQASRKVECYNVVRIDGQRRLCHLHGGHGKLDVVGAIAQSCNIYFYHLGQTMRAERLRTWAKRFGFGSRTGVDLPDEEAGSLPTGDSALISAELATGEAPGLSVTPLQMARAMCAMAGSGRLSKPWVKTPPKQAPPVVDRDALRWRRVSSVVRTGLEAAVIQGTARKAWVAGLPVVGKTGSPLHPYSPGTYGWFVGYAPTASPEIVVAVFLVNGQGPEHAAPIAAKVFTAYARMRKPQ